MTPLLLAIATLIAQPSPDPAWVNATAEVSLPKDGDLVVGSVDLVD